MKQKQYEKNERMLSVSILSLSLLTVMAGAAVAPALGIIKEHFYGTDQLFIQLIISIPAIFIVITNMFFPALCKKFTSKELTMMGLVLYTVGGCIAGLFDNIVLILMMRALVGIGVGIIMPLSTGLLSFYFPSEKQEKYMGYSSAMNQMGGVVATLIAGALSNISWRLSFMVYVLGLVSIVLCIIFLPSDKIANENSLEEEQQGGTFGKYYEFIIAMFLLMMVFFIYPSNFAIETVKDGIIPQSLISIIMASMDFIAFLGGLAFVICKKIFKENTRFLAPGLFLVGYILLDFIGGWIGTLIGSAFIGFANGIGIPFIISTSSKKAGKLAATTVMPLISASLYLAQFLAPFILSGVSTIVQAEVSHLPYLVAVILSVILCIWSGLIKKEVIDK